MPGLGMRSRDCRIEYVAKALLSSESGVEQINMDELVEDVESALVLRVRTSDVVVKSLSEASSFCFLIRGFGGIEECLISAS